MSLKNILQIYTLAYHLIIPSKQHRIRMIYQIMVTDIIIISIIFILIYDQIRQISSQEEVKESIKVIQQIIEKLLAKDLQKFSLCLAGFKPCYILSQNSWESVFTDSNFESICTSVKKMKNLSHFCISFGYLQTIKITENAELDKRNRFIKSWFGHPNSIFTGKGLKYMNEMLKKIVTKRKDFQSFDLDLFRGLYLQDTVNQNIYYKIINRCQELSKKTIKHTAEVINTLSTTKSMHNFSLTLWYLQDIDIQILKEPLMKFFQANKDLRHLNLCFSMKFIQKFHTAKNKLKIYLLEMIKKINQMKLSKDGLIILEEIIECLVENCQNLNLFRINLSASNATVESYNNEEINILNRIFLRLGCLNTLKYFSSTLGNWLNKEHLTADILSQSLIFILQNNPIEHLVINIGSDVRGGDKECLKDAKDVFNMLARCRSLKTLVILINGWKDCALAHSKVTEMLAGLIEKNQIRTFGLNLMNAHDSNELLTRDSAEIKAISQMFKVLCKFPFRKFGLSLSDWNLSKDSLDYFEFTQDQLTKFRDIRVQLELTSKILHKTYENLYRKELIWDIQRVCFFGKLNNPSKNSFVQQNKIIEI